MAVPDQQMWVYERLQRGNREVIDANRSIGERAAVIVGGGTALATLFGVGELWASKQPPVGLLIAAAIASLLAFVCASFVWAPVATSLPGSLDEEELWTNVINESEEVAIANMIRDEIASIEDERRGNAIRSLAFRLMLMCVWLQVTFVFAAVWFR